MLSTVQISWHMMKQELSMCAYLYPIDLSYIHMLWSHDQYLPDFPYSRMPRGYASSLDGDVKLYVKNRPLQYIYIHMLHFFICIYLDIYKSLRYTLYWCIYIYIRVCSCLFPVSGPVADPPSTDMVTKKYTAFECHPLAIDYLRTACILPASLHITYMTWHIHTYTFS